MSANIKPAASTALVLQDEGGTDVITISTSGNVGVGNGSPAQKLDVTGNINATGALTLGTALAVAEGGTGATDAATARTNLDVDQAGTDNSTDVSLVTTSHDYLSIAGQAITLGPIDLAADVTGSLPYASISGTPTLGTAAAEDVGYFATSAQGSLADSAVQPGDDANTLGSGSAADGYVLTADGSGGAAWEAKSPIDLLSSGASIRKSDGTTAVLSESSGTVTLENASLGDTVLMPDNSNNVSTAPGIRFEADTDTGIGLASAGNLAVVTSGSERMRIDSSGNVGIGTTSVLNFWDGSTFGKVRISGAGFASATIESTNNGDAALYFNSISGTSTDFWHRIRLDKTNKYLEFTGADQSIPGYVPASYMTTAGAWYQGNNSSSWSTTSDARIKENIRPITNALDKIDALKPCHFEYKTRQGKIKTGFIAQEFEQVLPGHVTEELPIKEFEGLIPSGEKLKSIDLDIVPYLVKAIQEQQALIESQQSQIDALTARIEALEA